MSYLHFPRDRDMLMPHRATGEIPGLVKESRSKGKAEYRAFIGVSKEKAR